LRLSMPVSWSMTASLRCWMSDCMRGVESAAILLPAQPISTSAENPRAHAQAAEAAVAEPAAALIE
jgi:hypothetical protein